MFQVCGIVVVFCLQLQKDSDKKKARRLNEEEIKKELINSITINDIIETEELNEKSEKIEKPEDATAIIKQYEVTQRKVFKRFKEKVNKSTIIFKMNKSLCDKVCELRQLL